MAQTRVGVRPRISPNSTLWNDLLAYYTADNTPNDALGTYNGTLTNGATYGTGIINQGFSFDGVNDYVAISPVIGASLSAPNKSHSYSAWVYPTNLNETYNFVFQNGDGISGTALILNTNKIGFFYKGGTYFRAGTATLTLNAWNHIVVVYDGGGLNNGNVSFYLNGAFDVTVATPYWTETPTYAYTQIGRYSSGAHFFNGLVDEVGVWNRELTASEVTELYNSGSGKQYPTGILPLWSDLLAYYTADNTPNDALGNYNGTLVNGATYGTGIINNGFSFDGVNNYVNLGDNLDIRLDSWTYNFWINMDTINRNNSILTKSDSGNNWERWWYRVNTSNQLEFHLQNGTNNATNRKYFRSTQTLSTSTWYMVTVVLDRTDKAYMYINGTPETIISTDGNGTSITNELSSWSAYDFNRTFNSCIGAFSNISNPFDGIIDEGGIWNRVLTASEVTQLYNSGSGKQYPN